MQIIIHNKEQDKYYWPAIQDDVTLEYNRKGAPGNLYFKVLKDNILNFHEGDTVRMNYNGANIFYGYVFIKRRNKDGSIAVTAYDQLRYLKNKDIYIIIDSKASDIIKRMAEDFQLQIGEIDDTEYVIPKHRSSNECLIDTIQDLLDKTMENTKKMFVLYDDFGKLMLKDIEKLKLDLLIDAKTAEDFSYESSIDKDTYNRVKLYYDNKETGKREVWIELDSANMKRWGVLQLTESVNAKKPLNFEQMADLKLKYFNRIKRTLTIQNALGDTRVRGGTMLYVNLNLGDMKLAKQIIVENVKHKFSNNLHLMDLTVRGDVITG